MWCIGQCRIGYPHWIQTSTSSILVMLLNLRIWVSQCVQFNGTSEVKPPTSEVKPPFPGNEKFHAWKYIWDDGQTPHIFNGGVLNVRSYLDVHCDEWPLLINEQWRMNIFFIFTTISGLLFLSIIINSQSMSFAILLCSSRGRTKIVANSTARWIRWEYYSILIEKLKWINIFRLIWLIFFI